MLVMTGMESDAGFWTVPRRVLSIFSLFTFACGCWLAVMELVLRHSGYLVRMGVDAAIAGIAVATFLVSAFRVGIRSERWAWAGGAALLGFGIYAFVQNARSAHFEGYAFLISLTLAFQGLLTLVSLGWRSAGTRR